MIREQFSGLAGRQTYTQAQRGNAQSVRHNLRRRLRLGARRLALLRR